MKVILKQTVRDIGKAGDVKEVADGYAQNFLINKGLAVRATPELIEQNQREMQKKEIESSLKKNHFLDILKSLDGKNITLNHRADSHGKLYQGISEGEIITEVRKEFNVILPKDLFSQFKPIKEQGSHKVSLKYLNDTASLTVTV